jgi:hypothetical protein
MVDLLKATGVVQAKDSVALTSIATLHRRQGFQAGVTQDTSCTVPRRKRR